MLPRGGQTILSKEEEAFLIHTIETFEKWQLPLLRKSVIEIARSYMLELGKKISSTAGLNDWFSAFMLSELWRNHILPSHCSSGFSRAGVYPYDPRAVTKEKLLIPPSSSTCSSTQLESNDDIGLLNHRNCRLNRSSSCNAFSTEALDATTTPLQQIAPVSATKLAINASSISNIQYGKSISLEPHSVQATLSGLLDIPVCLNGNDHHASLSSILMPQSTEIQNDASYVNFGPPGLISNGITMLGSHEQSLNAVSMVNIDTAPAQPNPLEAITNAINGFLTPSVPLSNEKRRFVLERPYGESLTSVEALRKVNEKEKFDFKRKKRTSIAREERKKSEKVRSKRGRKPTNRAKKNLELMHFDELSNENDPTRASIIYSQQTTSSCVPSTVPYFTQADVNLHFNQTVNNPYSYPLPTVNCFRCDQILFANGYYAKCTGCTKICCFSCANGYYKSTTTYFVCEHCSLHRCLISTQLM
ncbi:unnamed protein product [Rotaria sp. Silwood2]|nr:unnamed protein product [Rotaria sp. Silwood2]